MEKSFCLGLLLGAVGGALIVANSKKAHRLVKKSQDEIKQKVSDFAEEKIDEMEANNSPATKTVTKAKRA